jgi:hypothetical protein
VQIIRQQGILARFPGRVEADLYLWIIEHYHYLRKRGEVSLAEVAEHFAREYGQRPRKQVLRGMRRLLEEVVRVRPRAGAHGG